MVIYIYEQSRTEWYRYIFSADDRLRKHIQLLAYEVPRYFV